MIRFIFVPLAIFMSLVSACSQADLGRPEAESAIAKSQQIDALAATIQITSNAIDEGRAQGLWERQRNGDILLRAQAAEEIKLISGRHITPIKRPEIKIEVTGIADSPATEKIKEVQFTWGYASLSPIARRFAIDGGRGRAAFRRYDDGWRIEGLETLSNNKPLVLSTAEKSAIEQDIARERAQQEEIQRFVESSWTPTTTVRQFDYPPAVNQARSTSYSAMTVKITDVDVSYGTNTVWFGHVGDIGVSQRGHIYLNNRNLVGGYIHEHPMMNSEEVASILKAAVGEWRIKYRDQLPADTGIRYMAAKRRGK